MPSFPDHDLQPDWCRGDLSLQLHADDPDTVLHALRDIARHTPGRNAGSPAPRKPT
ncbi:Dyp-type peroxidase domain-containing protein [Streptomyces chartreusis]|uniref:Dyp-type peroxidase domain-containing protein n=1 Tax=Streptomyces chartreusis TaxID=1969 RepID=UPI000262D610